MSKTCFFTSSMMTTVDVNEESIPTRIANTNQFLDRLQAVWPHQANILMISSSPLAYEINDYYRDIYKVSFQLSDLSYHAIDVLDARTDYDIHDYDVLILAGGHVPTQNEYFKKINLKETIHPYQGIIVGISAGSMNAADIVYAMAEEVGEALASNKPNLLKGLGLFDKRMVPHVNELVGQTLDGLDIMVDIALKDSHQIDFYAIEDGVYFYLEKDVLYLAGEADYYRDGKITKIGKHNALTQL